MNTVQSAAVIALSMTAAVRIILFDARGKTHKPLSAAIAYMSIVWLCSIALSAAFALNNLTCWLLIFGLALHTGAILWSGGNINRLHPKKTMPETENRGFLSRASAKKAAEDTFKKNWDTRTKGKNA